MSRKLFQNIANNEAKLQTANKDFSNAKAP